MSDAPKVYRFERYRNGQLMAEGIKITKAYTFKQATLSAAKLADAGDVLVFDPPDDADLVNELIAAAYEDAFDTFSAGDDIHRDDYPEWFISRWEEFSSLTPDDARAAQAARDKRVREEALREAAEQVNRNLGKPAHHAHAAILALI